MNKAKPYLRSNYVNKNNQYPISIKVKIDNKIRVLSLNIYIEKKYWDNKKNLVKNTHSDFIIINNTIEYNLKLIKEYLLKCNVNLTKPNYDTIKQLISIVKPKNKTDFFEFAENYLLEKKINYSKSYEKQIFYEIKKIKTFKENINIEDINTDFLKEYEKYMITVLMNKHNTVHKTFKRLRMILKDAMKNDIIKKSSFEEFKKIKYEKTFRDFLTISELRTLENLYYYKAIEISIKKLLNVFFLDVIQAYVIVI